MAVMSTRIGSFRDQHPHARLIPALAKVAMIGLKEGMALAAHDVSQVDNRPGVSRFPRRG